MEKLLQLDINSQCQIATFCEEPRAAYNRVKLTSYFETRDPSALSMTGDFDTHGRTAWYDERRDHVELYVGDKAVAIDTTQKVVTGASGTTIPYDICVLATGSFPFVPPIPGRNRPGVFVYRTIEDLENMLTYAKTHNVKAAAVIGGGLLGLEAAKAAADMGLGTLDTMDDDDDIAVRVFHSLDSQRMLASDLSCVDYEKRCCPLLQRVTLSNLPTFSCAVKSTLVDTMHSWARSKTWA